MILLKVIIGIVALAAVVLAEPPRRRNQRLRLPARQERPEFQGYSYPKPDEPSNTYGPP